MEVSNRYSIIREVATGGMARVYLATDTVLGREVAVKMLHRHLLENQHSLRRFETEAHVVAQLSHENVIKLFDYGVDAAGERFLVMEFVNGKTIEELVQIHKVFPNLVLLEIFVQVLSGHPVAHQKGIYHRDVKPSNIMIDEYGCVKIMDFGIAYLVNQGSITLTGTFVGSPNYISPEQAEGRTISEKSDLFSAATLMYECATGSCPFVGDNVHATLNAILNYDPPPAYQQNPRLVSEISGLIGACLKKEVSQRPTPPALLQSIDGYCRELGVTLGKKRVVDFLADPVGYAKREEAELYETLCARAREYSRHRKTVHALKYFTQAKQFGELSPFDRKLIDRMKGSALAVRIIPVIIAAALLLCGGYWLVNVTRRLAPTPAQAVTASAVGRIAAPVKPPDTAALPVPPVRLTGLSASVAASLKAPTIGRAFLKRPAIDTSFRRNQPVVGADKVGYVRVRTNPPWSDIYLNGDFVGVFPKISLIPSAPGRHRLTVKNSRCADTVDIIDVVAGDTTVRDIVLRPLVGTAPDHP